VRWTASYDVASTINRATAGAGALTLAGVLADGCLGALCCSLASVPAAAAPAAFTFTAGGASTHEGR